DMVSADMVKVELNFTSLRTSGQVFIDDIRFQPMDAEVTCYVFDPLRVRLIAQFDEQHFATHFQYNAEGKLIRKLAETEEGVLTIAETQYHTPVTKLRDGVTNPATAVPGGNNGMPPAKIGFGTQQGELETDTLGGVHSKFDILNIELGKDKRKIQVFGLDS